MRRRRSSQVIGEISSSIQRRICKNRYIGRSYCFCVVDLLVQIQNVILYLLEYIMYRVIDVEIPHVLPYESGSIRSHPSRYLEVD